MTGMSARTVARWAALGVVGAGLAVVAGYGVQSALATAEYQHAQAVRLDQSLRLEVANATLDDAIHDAYDEVALAEAALVAAPVGYVSAEAAASLEAANAALTVAIRAATGSAVHLPAAPAALVDPAALRTAADELLEQAARADAATVEQAEAILQLGVAEAANAEAGSGLLASARAVASTVLPANPSVANTPHVEYLRTMTELAAHEQLDEVAVELLTQYVGAVGAVTASHAAEEAEKSGPLYGLRAEVEAYARSISGGVLLDFNWQPIVIGYSMAGTATIERSDPYLYSTITLTNSIASNWGDTVPVSLVTHEVGHAITSKCMDAFDAAFGGNYEIWATAWAMSWGFPAGASGADSYGVPTPDQVAIAGTCR